MACPCGASTSRLKKDVAAELPEKVEKVIKCRMSALQEIMYKEFMMIRRCVSATSDTTRA